ncbi:tRNA (adenosine(37)-N6)-threonylcarbamoyltransferase complex ATPase subunit type 1 TsaE [Gammaproteobacteria bacterium]|nr:tRNA (adenosine(37)-N6)-threonylcarbamoyltransferase complex ATPase subunit type 1 TsaE [Gammaproteobacteria bacterium]
MLELILKNETDTLALGAAINQAVGEMNGQDIEVHLSGNLGAGKTTLVRGMLHNAGWQGSVTSPSYTLCEEYQLNNQLFLHVDLYRTGATEDIEILDLDRKSKEQKIIFLEWPENLVAKRSPHLIIELLHYHQQRQAQILSEIHALESSIQTYYEKI